MTLRLASMLFAALVAAGSCGVADDAALSRSQARHALIDAEDLPGTWTRIDVPRTTATGPSPTDTSPCARATRRLAAAVAPWGEASVRVEKAYADGQALFKQEIASDARLDAGRLRVPLLAQAEACRAVRSSSDGVAYETTLQSCPVDGGIEIVQTWNGSDARSGATEFVYLLQGRTLIVLTLVSGQAPTPCGSGLIGAAAARAQRALTDAGE